MKAKDRPEETLSAVEQRPLQLDVLHLREVKAVAKRDQS